MTKKTPAKKRAAKKAATPKTIRINFDLDNAGLAKFLSEHPDIKNGGILPNGNRSLTAQEVKALVKSDMPLADIRAKVLEGVPPEKGETFYNPQWSIWNIPTTQKADTGDVQIKGSPEAVAKLVKQLGAKQ